MVASGYAVSAYYLEHDLSSYPAAWNLQFDESTGALTMTPSHGGTHRVVVLADATRTSDSQPTAARAYADVEANAAYQINVDHASFSLQDGTVGARRTFTATTTPPQPSAGETWTLVRSQDLPSTLTNTAGAATFDFDTEVAAGNNLQTGQHWFQFSRSAGGVEVLSKPIRLNVAPAPSVIYAPQSSPGAEIGDGWSVSNFGTEITIEANVPVHIPANRLNGATNVIDRSAAPSWLQTDDIPLPTGLSFESDGDIVGTATQLVSAAENLWVPVYSLKSTSPAAYGLGSVQFIVEEPSDDPYADTDGNGVPDGAEHPDNDLDGDGIPNRDDTDKDGDGIPDDEEASYIDIYMPSLDDTYFYDGRNQYTFYGDDSGFIPANGPYATQEAARLASDSDDCMDPFLYSRGFSGFVEQNGFLVIQWGYSGPINLC